MSDIRPVARAAHGQPCSCGECRSWREHAEADPFVTRVYPGGQEGHEIITRVAAARAGVPANRRSALLLGVIRPDRGGRSYLNFIVAAPAALLPSTQAAHALRATRGTATGAALAAIRAHFIDLYRRAMREAPFSAKAFEWLGEALHLLQDSYSRAHVARSPAADPAKSGPFRIAYVRNFGPLTGKWREHGFPTDPRDVIVAGRSWKPEAVVAARASTEFLELAMAHMRARGAPGNARQLVVFVNRHLA